ncbi:MAG: PqqD family protein [Alteraurantiacibacter sp.]
MELSDKVAVSENVVTREVSGETVLLDLEKGTYFGLNTVGGRIWTLVEEEPRTLSQVKDVVCSEFAVSEQDAQRDVLDLASQLHEHGLLTRAD